MHGWKRLPTGAAARCGGAVHSPLSTAVAQHSAKCYATLGLPGWTRGEIARRDGVDLQTASVRAVRADENRRCGRDSRGPTTWHESESGESQVGHPNLVPRPLQRQGLREVDESGLNPGHIDVTAVSPVPVQMRQL